MRDCGLHRLHRHGDVSRLYAIALPRKYQRSRLTFIEALLPILHAEHELGKNSTNTIKSTRKHYVEPHTIQVFTFNCKLSIHRVTKYEGLYPPHTSYPHIQVVQGPRDSICHRIHPNRQIHCSPVLEHLYGTEHLGQT